MPQGKTNKKEGIPKRTMRIERSLGKKSMPSGTDEPKGKNDTYLLQLKSYVKR